MVKIVNGRPLLTCVRILLIACDIIGYKYLRLYVSIAISLFALRQYCGKAKSDASKNWESRSISDTSIVEAMVIVEDMIVLRSWSSMTEMIFVKHMRIIICGL